MNSLVHRAAVVIVNSLDPTFPPSGRASPSEAPSPEDLLPRPTTMQQPGDIARDPLTRTHVMVSELCNLYTNALGNVQNEADRHVGTNNLSTQSVERMATEFADQIVKAHQDIDALGAELEQAYRSESEQMDELRVLHAARLDATQLLRAETEAAERVHAQVAERQEALVEGIIQTNAKRKLVQDGERLVPLDDSFATVPQSLQAPKYAPLAAVSKNV